MFNSAKKTQEPILSAISELSSRLDSDQEYFDKVALLVFAMEALIILLLVVVIALLIMILMK